MGLSKGVWIYVAIDMCVGCACMSAGCESLWISVEIHVWVWVCLLLRVGVSV